MLIDKVIWQEGMLLRPQHLQHNDRYYHQQLTRRSQLSQGYAWGFLTLEIDPQYLDMGKVVVNQASGVLPDGTLFDMASPLVMQIPANSPSQAVYLALPMLTGNAAEVRDPAQADVLARYTTYEVEVADANAGEDTRCAISCARADFRLLLGDDHEVQTYVRLKVAQVLDCNAQGVVQLDSTFSPTFMHLHGSPFLLSCLKEVVSLLAFRGDAIAARLRSAGQAAGAEMGDFLMLQLINRTELTLRHCLDQPRLGPDALYQALLGLLGELSTFSSATKRACFEGRYRHSDQGPSFGELMAAIRSVLSMVLEQHAIELVLQPRQYGVLVCPVNDLNLLGSATFILAVSAQCDSEVLRLRLPAHLKVGPVERIRELVNLHLAGIHVKPMAVAPRQIPFHAEKTYFMLELSARDLEQLEHSGGFAFHVSGEFADLELKFWAIRN
ncbi:MULTISPECIES: type VI secretion system baseplate subunit TssK [unclassified Pseudomonas]|uniref:type VI secretion system baseplate subunit TssK n=1 Tax=unclassified Pseudomonas TaxID=196821 RepID=UPI0014738403|nr:MULTISPECIES: type VI secretion system baseplate subunit TssK [unclassified Pseudomonas]NMX90800.1 type VI secretion system baseplate subunit TssK [Pseudomonas sp. WS 5086]NMY45596.1 type VI secretion system baseplate subunit TssK [Pseudomonas sp. WS 5027]